MTYANDKTLPPASAALMQAAFNRRTASGFIGKDGAAHTTKAAKAMHDAGVSQFSREYFNACFDGAKA
jgi:hypothetical protein